MAKRQREAQQKAVQTGILAVSTKTRVVGVYYGEVGVGGTFTVRTQIAGHGVGDLEDTAMISSHY